MNRRVTILLLIPHLSGGGAERVTALLAENLDSQKYKVHLALVTTSRSNSCQVSPHITVHALGARRARYAIPKICRLVWKLRPNVILSGMAHLNLVVLLLRPLFPRKTRILVRQNGLPRSGDAGRFTPLLYRMLYRRADGVICQTDTMAEETALATRWAANLHVLPNPLDLKSIQSHAHDPETLWSRPGPHLLGIGRLAPEKGFDLLIRALKRLHLEFPKADLTIIGAGREESRLRSLARQLQLEQSVRFAGYVPDPHSWFAGASLFVLSSLREGMPNALLEAAAAGLPIVATPAEGGLCKTLARRDGIWLAHDISVEAIQQALSRALHSLAPVARFPHHWTDEFRTERAIPRYEALIDSVLATAP